MFAKHGDEVATGEADIKCNFIVTLATNRMVLLSIHNEKGFLGGKHITEEPSDARVSSTSLIAISTVRTQG